MRALAALAALGLLFTTGCMTPGCSTAERARVSIDHTYSPPDVREAAYQHVRDTCDLPNWHKPGWGRSVERGTTVCSSSVGYDGTVSAICTSY